MGYSTVYIFFIFLKKAFFFLAVFLSSITMFGTAWKSMDETITFYPTSYHQPLNIAPVISAIGNQVYCPQTYMKIVTDVTIVDPDDLGTDAIYVQISSGYIIGQDQLLLSGTHPNITTLWLPTEGKLKLSSPTGATVLYADFIAAIKDVEFYNSSATPSGTRVFSISIGQANYLPSTGHYYYYVPSLGITWSDAKIAAEASFYYDLQGYLVTINALDEAQLAGAQAAGAGWIGGSDEAVEGQWRWVTGPENGNLFTFTFWNNGEPNNQGNEDYAHITAPGVGIPGSWNDLSNTGSPSGDYQPKGYVVEYGGMPGDPILQIATSTMFTIPEITSSVASTRCGTGSVILQASASVLNVLWYDAPNGGNLLGTGTLFTTPILSNTTTYYAQAACALTRIPVIATVNTIASISTTNSPVSRCGNGSVTLQATSNTGIVNWYASPSGGSVLSSGVSFLLFNVTQNAVYYVDAVNNGCTDGIRIPVQVFVYPIPNVTNENVILCENGSVLLNAGIPNMSYNWSNGAITQTTSVSTPGTYTVNVTSPQNCSNQKTVTVEMYLNPVIDYIDVHQDQAVIYLTNPQPYYEYSVDGIQYQSSNEFFNIPGGLQTAYVRDVALCNADSERFIVIFIPNFFTPNEDSYNDLWEIRGMSVYPNATVTIFNRFGKYIATLDNFGPSWDGKYNGLPLPASDYWFVLRLDDELPEVRGHFTLKR